MADLLARAREQAATDRQRAPHRVEFKESAEADHGSDCKRVPVIAIACERSVQRCLRLARQAFARNEFQEALNRYAEAVSLGADAGQYVHERWTCLMKLGQYELAWEETDRTEALRRASGDTTRNLPLHLQRVWDGTPVAGKRVLVHCYHGLGDTIQFARFLSVLSEVASRVIVQPQPELTSLLESFSTIHPHIVCETAPNAKDFDLEVELMELPYIFRTRVSTIPAAVPYLRAAQGRIESRRDELVQLGLRSDSLNVGLVWSSGDWNPERNLNQRELPTLTDIDGVRWFSLQRGRPAAEIESSDLGLAIIPTEKQSGTPVDTAAAIANLDLIISVDTMVAHLSGALGKPVWTLLPYSADWRWMIDREDTPWYPTMRLFRQPRRGDWKSVVARVKAELNRFATARKIS